MKIVLVHPQIPPNTGSVGRLCAANGIPLVLVEPLGFSLDERHLRRAGLDYWPWIDLEVVPDWRQALVGAGTPWLFTAKATRLYTDVAYRECDLLVFGTESTGLPAEVLDAHPDSQVRIPMVNPAVRSLNLAQCAAVALYEALRQQRAG